MSNPQQQPFRKLMKLEAMRGVAALYVFVHHFVHDSPELVSLRKFFIFGQFALMVFFILSGFVIYYATVFRNPEITFREYFLRRFRRIFPAFVLVLVLTYFLMCLTYQRWVPLHLMDFLGNLLQIQDKNPVAIVAPYQRNSPLWSLAYEWWFYMIFYGIYALFKKSPRKQKFVAIGLSAVGFVTFVLVPNQVSLFASYFVLWWAGLELAREWTTTGKITPGFQWPAWTAVLVLGLGWVAYAGYLHEPGEPVVLAIFPYVQARHFLTVNLVLIMGFVWYKLNWIGFNRLFGWGIFLAPLTYAIYIIHYPLVYLSIINRPTGHYLLDLLWMVPVVYGLAWAIEHPYQKFFNRLIKVKSARSRRAAAQKPR